MGLLSSLEMALVKSNSQTLPSCAIHYRHALDCAKSSAVWPPTDFCRQKIAGSASRDRSPSRSRSGRREAGRASFCSWYARSPTRRQPCRDADDQRGKWQDDEYAHQVKRCDDSYTFLQDLRRQCHLGDAAGRRRQDHHCPSLPCRPCQSQTHCHAQRHQQERGHEGGGDKAANVIFATALAKQLGPRGIRGNAVSPARSGRRCRSWAANCPKRFPSPVPAPHSLVLAAAGDRAALRSRGQHRVELLDGQVFQQRVADIAAPAESCRRAFMETYPTPNLRHAGPRCQPPLLPR